MRISLHRVSELTPDQIAAVLALKTDVYPADVLANWPGKSIEWSAAPWCVVCWDDDDKALSYVGIHLREAVANTTAVMIGGIGGVKTHPAARRRGLASKAMGRAIEFFKDHDVDFGLLVCEPELVALYEWLGWRLFDGSLLVVQQSKAVPFTFARAMVYPIRGPTPTTGVIDLHGLPW
jgi:hypothetical protein